MVSAAGLESEVESAVNVESELACYLACQQIDLSDSIAHGGQHGRGHLGQNHWECHYAKVRCPERYQGEDGKN